MTQWNPEPIAEQRPPLRRSTDSRLAGVSGGIGQYIGLDANIVRVLFVVLAVFGGSGFLVYLGAWLLMLPPLDEGGFEPPSGKAPVQRATGPLVLGGVLLGFAVLLALFTLDGFPGIPFAILTLFFVGFALLHRRSAGPITFDGTNYPPPVMPVQPIPGQSVPGQPIPGQQMPVPPTPVADPDLAAPDWEAPDRTTPMPELDPEPGDPQPSGSDPTDQEPSAIEATDPEPDETLEVTKPDRPIPPVTSPPNLAPTSAFVNLADPEPVAPIGPRPHWAVPRTMEETTLAPAEQPPRGAPIAAITIAAIGAVLGVALVLNTLADIFVGAVTVTGIGLGFTGIAIATTAYRGRILPLLPIAALLSGILVISPVIDHALQDGTGLQDIAVDSVEELQNSYSVGVGEVILDLRRLEITEDTAVRIEVGTGAVEVWLPDDTVTEIHAEVTVGWAEVLGESRGGINSRLNVLPALGADPDAPRLLIVSSVEIGGIDVYRG